MEDWDMQCGGYLNCHHGNANHHHGDLIRNHRQTVPKSGCWGSRCSEHVLKHEKSMARMMPIRDVFY